MARKRAKKKADEGPDHVNEGIDVFLDFCDKTKKLADIPIDVAATRVLGNLLPAAAYYEGAKYLSTTPFLSENSSIDMYLTGFAGAVLAAGLWQINKPGGLLSKIEQTAHKKNMAELKNPAKKGFSSYVKTAAIAGLALLCAHTGNVVKTDYESGHLFGGEHSRLEQKIETAAKKKEDTIHPNTELDIVQNFVDKTIGPESPLYSIIQHPPIFSLPELMNNPVVYGPFGPEGLRLPGIPSTHRPERSNNTEHNSILNPRTVFDYLSIFEGAKPKQKIEIKKAIDSFKRDYQNSKGINKLVGPLQVTVLLEDRVKKESHLQGVDPAVSLPILGIENGGRLDCKSFTGNVGPFQLGDSSFIYCGGKIRYASQEIPVTKKIHKNGKVYSKVKIVKKSFKVYDERYDPRINVHVGVKYIHFLQDMFGNKGISTLAFNQGPTTVKRQIRDYIIHDRPGLVSSEILSILKGKQNPRHPEKDRTLAKITPEFIKSHNINLCDLLNSPYLGKKYFTSNNGGKDYAYKGVGIIEMAKEAQIYGVCLDDIPSYDKLFSPNYTIRPNETLQEIARKNHISMGQFLKYNRQFIDPRYARPGDVYKLPISHSTVFSTLDTVFKVPSKS